MRESVCMRESVYESLCVRVYERYIVRERMCEREYVKEIV